MRSLIDKIQTQEIRKTFIHFTNLYYMNSRYRPCGCRLFAKTYFLQLLHLALDSFKLNKMQKTEQNLKNIGKLGSMSPCPNVLHLAEHGSLSANFPLLLFCSLPDLASKVSILFCHWFGKLLPSGLVCEVWFWLEVIFEVYHLFFKNRFCTIQGSCWFFVPTSVQRHVTLSSYAWRNRIKPKGECTIVL